jgi:hypothetical protein
MRGVMVVYIVLVMFMAMAEDTGYSGTQLSGANTSEIQGMIENTSYQYQNSSGILEPLKASAGFLNTFLDIVANSLVFNFTIDGAPAQVNYIVRAVFFVLGWLAFYDIVVLMLSILAGVVSRLL